ncbi:MAG: PD-(D/E)XK nuclease family protein [Bacteroidales bacterium]|nr:PD-(D/E)XK nuclease family protein [Bacteroidales bacterium]MCF8333653.1 PD-(D/E)XK nuclease family protein [Bacteroidales bacterium]
MKKDLFNSLRKYPITESRNPIENFLTEAFAWLLSSYPAFSEYFLNVFIKDKLTNNIKISNSGYWSTQKSFNQYYPDMVYEYNRNALIFEHKVWSNLHESQLENYRNYASKNYDNYDIILITATKIQHDQKPDLALCWEELYYMIDKWIKNSNSKDVFLFESFQNLLLNEGIGPPAPISHASILYYYISKNLENNIVKLINRVISNYQIDNLFTNKNINQINDFALRPYKKEKWGRIGIELFDDWKPSIFIGFLLDGQDHCTTLLLGEKSPDFSIIISFEEKYHSIYPNDETYNSLVKHLKKKVEELKSGWDFYHHIEDDKVKEKNFWHPIHIRKPMLHLFQGTEKGEEQEQRFIDATNEIIAIIDDSEYFHELKAKHL